MTEYSDQVDKETKALMEKNKGKDTAMIEGAMAAIGVLDYYQKVKGNGKA